MFKYFQTIYIHCSNGKSAQRTKKKLVLRKDIIEAIIKMLDDVNPYVGRFRCAREKFNMNPGETFYMRIVSDRKKDGRTYSMPTASEVAAIIPRDFRLEMPTRDIVIKEKSGRLQRISEVHLSYLALKYTLLFSRGEDGYRPGIQKGDKRKNKTVSMR